MRRAAAWALAAALAGAPGAWGQTVGALQAPNDLSEIGAAGATAQGTARTNLGLGSIATQGAGAVAITGGTVTGADLSGADVTAANGGSAQTLAARMGEILDLKAFGAEGNAIEVVPNPKASNAVYGATMTAGSAVLTTTNGPFTAAMVGESIDVGGAGASGGVLATTIASYQSADQVTLAAAASASVPTDWISTLAFGGGTITASYAPGDTVSFGSGTFATAGVGTVKTTTPMDGSVAAGGSGGTAGTCTVAGTFAGGSALNGNLQFTASVTISAGAITVVNSVSGAQFSANPPTLGPLAVSNSAGCGSISGATINVVMGPGWTEVTTPGSYTVFPTSPLAPSATSGTGAGATFTLTEGQTGEFLIGHDDTGAINAAVAEENLLAGLGVPACIYAPPGNYGVFGSALTQFAATVPGCVVGRGGPLAAAFLLNPTYGGPAFSTSEAWQQNTVGLNAAAISTWQSPGLAGTGPTFANISIMCDRADPNGPAGIIFYDRNDRVLVRNVTVQECPGRAISMGALTKNTTVAYVRESRVTALKLWDDGASGAPVFEITSVGNTASNEISCSDVNVYAPFSQGVWIHSGGNAAAYSIRCDGVRVEGQENNPAGVATDLVELGDTTNTGSTVQDVQLSHLDLIDPYFGASALGIYAATSAAQPYGIRAAGYIGGGIPYGAGLDVQAGRLDSFRFGNIAADGYDVTIGAAPAGGGTVGTPNVIAGAGASSWTWSIAASAEGSVFSPVLAAGQPGAPVPGMLLGWQLFTTSGTYTPPVGATELYIEAVGSGGCGGAAQATSTGQMSVGGGGGAGAYGAAWETGGISSLTVTIGAVPTCVTTNGGNTVGNASTVAGSGWTLMAPGGRAGFGSGVLSAANVQSGGGPSAVATVGTGALILGAGAPGCPGIAISSTGGVGGCGGTSQWGGGGGSNSTSGTAAAAVGYGSGGGGAWNGASTGAATAGGTPTAGAVLIFAYQ